MREGRAKARALDNISNSQLARRYDSVEEIKKKTTSAFALGTALLVTQAELMCPSLDRPNSSSGPLVAQVLAENSTTSPFIALSCAEGTSRAVLTSHCDVESKMPHLVRIPDPTVGTFVQVARTFCEEKRGVTFSDDLMPELTAHVSENLATSKGLVPKGMRTAKTLIDSGIRCVQTSERLLSFTN